jgi:hypothetical protein
MGSGDDSWDPEAEEREAEELARRHYEFEQRYNSPQAKQQRLDDYNRKRREIESDYYDHSDAYVADAVRQILGDFSG